MFNDQDRALLQQVHAVTAKSGYIEKLVNMEQEVVGDINELLERVKADPNTGAGAGDLSPAEAAKAVADLLASRLAS